MKRLILSALLAFAGSARAALYSEAAFGDLSNDRLAPTFIDLGTYQQLQATVTFGERDYFTITIPAGKALQALLLSQYQSDNTRAFLGFQPGSAFTVAPQDATPADLLGYAHFGLDNALGQDLLDDLAANPGTIGFTRPLPAGTYTFWLNQTEPAPTTVTFTFVVPEPAALMSLLPVTFLLSRTRRFC